MNVTVGLNLRRQQFPVYTPIPGGDYCLASERAKDGHCGRNALHQTVCIWTCMKLAFRTNEGQNRRRRAGGAQRGEETLGREA